MALRLKGDALPFGGDKAEKKKKKKKEKKHKKRKRDDSDYSGSDDDDDDGDNIDKGDKSNLSKKVEEVLGSGRIVVSGDTVQGLNTKFAEEVDAGDVIRILHPQKLQEESRLVSEVLGNRSATLVSAFSSNFSSTVEFTIEKHSTLLKKKAERAAKKAKKAKEEEGEGNEEDSAAAQSAYDKAMRDQLNKAMEKKKNTILVREKVSGAGGVSYRTVEKNVGKEMGAGDQLTERSKQGRDKYCW